MERYNFKLWKQKCNRMLHMTKKERKKGRKKNNGHKTQTDGNNENGFSLEQPTIVAMLQPDTTSGDGDDNDETVRDSQECVGSSQLFEDDQWKDFESKTEYIFSLYEQMSGAKCLQPELSKCPRRNEYRKLFCIGTVCQKLEMLLSSRLASKKNLLAQRLESLNQLKALCLQMEGYINENLASEKYLSFDDAAQRNTLEIMGIRYEELLDDIFAFDGEFTSLFDEDEMIVDNDNKGHNQSRSSSECLDPEGNYAELCMQSKLTEVGLRYVDKAYKVLRRTNTKVSEYRAKTSQCVENLRAVELELSQICDEFGEMAPLVVRVMGLNQTQKPMAKKASSY